MAGSGRGDGPARAGPGRRLPWGTVAVAALAASCCLAAVLVAGALGPVALSGDSMLDRLSVGSGATLDGEQDGEQGEVAVVGEEDVLPEPDGGVPPEVVLSMLAATVAAALLVRAVLRARHDPVAEVDGEPDDLPGGAADLDLLESVAEAARAGLDRLGRARPGEADEAVLACWVELEAAADRLGSGRTGPDTPTDFAARLTAAVPGLDAAVLDDLRRTYSRVRFGPGRAGPDDVARARAALEDLLAVLAPAVPRSAVSQSALSQAAVPRSGAR